MTAATTARATTYRQDHDAVPVPYKLGIAASTTLLAGTIWCKNAAGYVVPATTATTLVCLGRGNKSWDNSTGANDAFDVDFEAGVFPWENSAGGDEITIADIGNLCFLVDNQTVAKTDGGSTRSKAGVVVDVIGTQVWVQMGLFIQAPGDVLIAGTGLTRVGDTLNIDFPIGAPLTDTFTHADLTAAATSETLNVGAALPANARIYGFNIKLATPFSGGGAAAVSVEVGSAGDADAIVDGADLFAAAVDGQASSAPAGIAPYKHFALSTQITATFTSNVNVADLDAGSVTIEIYYFIAA